MSIDFDDALARARDRTPFSNGTEWEAWSSGWCDRCLRDAPFRNTGKGKGCALILVALSERTPAEWMEPEPSPSGLPYLGPRAYTCIEFRAPGDGGGEPRPRPDPPDMDALFPRPERRTRMLVPVEPPVTTRQYVTHQTTGELL